MSISDGSVLSINVTETSLIKQLWLLPLKKEDYWKSTLKTMVPFGLRLEKVCERLCFWHPCCVGLGAAMFGDKKVF